MFSNVKVRPTKPADKIKNEYTENKGFYENQFPNENFDKLFMKLLVLSIFSFKVTLD